MKAIILAGGAGTRLAPMTTSISKQALPIYDKPMIYYPLSLIMLAGIRDILLISTPRDLPIFQALLSDGQQLGLNIGYAEQLTPDGLAQAFLIGEQFLDGSAACLILGDNVFYGQGLQDQLRLSANLTSGAEIYAYAVSDPERYGVVSFDENGVAESIVEKPNKPLSNWAVSGLYFYDHQIVDIAKAVKPSPRGELEITDINNAYLQMGKLCVRKMSRGYAWFDTGTPDSLQEAAAFVQTISRRQSFKIACLEEIALQKGWIEVDQALALADEMGKGDYAQYVQRRAQEIAEERRCG